MNTLYTITWPDDISEAAARQLYGKLRASMARGALFPFSGPYEIALVSAGQAAGQSTANWAVAVLAMHFTSSEADTGGQGVSPLESWFSQCIPEGMPAGARITPGEATHLRLDSELRPNYEVVESFGTFVGEPEIETPPAAEEVNAGQASNREGKNSPESSPPMTPEAEALKALVEHPLFTEVGLPTASEAKQGRKEQLPSIPPPPAATRAYSQPSEAAGRPENVDAKPATSVAKPATSVAKPATVNGTRTCLTLGLLIAGVLVSLGGLATGALFAFGQYAASPESGSGPMSPSDFVLALACCPAPIFLVGIGLIAAGVVIPRFMPSLRQNR